MTSSTKPGVHNILHCRQRTTEIRPRVTCTENIVKFVHVISRYATRQTDLQTYRHADRNTSVKVLLWPPWVADPGIIFCPVVCSIFFLFSSPNLSRRRLDICPTQKSPNIHHLRTIAQLCRAVSSQLRHISTIGKKY